MAVKNDAAKVYERLLILRCQAGDEAALGELVQRYSPGLRLFLSKVTGRPALADDLLQDTWFDAYRKINRLVRPEAFTTWVYRIARDKAFVELRRRRPMTQLSEQSIDPAAPDVQFTPEEARQVRLALDNLPLEQREVLVLKFIEDMSYEQIAEVVGCPLGTVRSRIHYAKQSLRALLESDHTGKDSEP